MGNVGGGGEGKTTHVVEVLDQEREREISKEWSDNAADANKGARGQVQHETSNEQMTSIIIVANRFATNY